MDGSRGGGREEETEDWREQCRDAGVDGQMNCKMDGQMQIDGWTDRANVTVKYALLRNCGAILWKFASMHTVKI